VWVGYPNALTEMRSVHGVSVAGGTFPAQIWGAYMRLAKGADCSSFPLPQERATFSPFYGRYSRASRSLGGRYRGDRSYGGTGSYSAPAPTGPGDNSAGGQNYRGYDPRLYESPPQSLSDGGTGDDSKPRGNGRGRGRKGDG
jgi:penicillin-binding protein 1A